MAEGFSSPIDTGLAASPSSGIEQQAIYDEFSKVYNAIRILQQKLGDYAGLGVLDPSNYLNVSPTYADAIQIHRLQAIVVTSSELINARAFVNLWSSTGLKVRNADASGGLAKRAWGWAPDPIANGATGIIYLQSGYLPSSGLTLGALYYLSASSPGGITTTAPVAVGNIRQEVGLALSANDLFARISTPIVL